MIVSLTGRVAGRDDKSITLDVHGVGFRIFVLPAVLETATDQALTVVTHLHIREDAMELYGFFESPGTTTV